MRTFSLVDLSCVSPSDGTIRSDVSEISRRMILSGSFMGFLQPAVKFINEAGFFDLFDNAAVHKTCGLCGPGVWMGERVKSVLNAVRLRNRVFSQTTGKTVVKIFCGPRI